MKYGQAANQEKAAESKHQHGWEEICQRKGGSLKCCYHRGECSVCLFFLPWTVRTAEVFWSPHTHVYSPVSSTSRSRINSSADVSSCLILYLSLGLSVLSPFFHSTGTPTLLSSQCSVAVAPSVASLFFKPSLKNAGKAERQQYEQWDIMLQRVKIKLWCLISLFLLILVYQHKNINCQ